MKKISQKLNQKLLLGKLRLEEWGKELLTDERGDTNIIAIILILVVVVGLVIIFRDRITALVNRIFGAVDEDVNSILGT